LRFWRKLFYSMGSRKLASSFTSSLVWRKSFNQHCKASLAHPIYIFHSVVRLYDTVYVGYSNYYDLNSNHCRNTYVNVKLTLTKQVETITAFPADWVEKSNVDKNVQKVTDTRSTQIKMPDKYSLRQFHKY